MRLPSFLIFLLALIYAPFIMPYCDIHKKLPKCDPHHCYAGGGRCLPDFGGRCQQGTKQFGKAPQYEIWRRREVTKSACEGCSCKSANPAIIQSQQEMKEFVAHMKQTDDLDEAALERKVEGDAALCEMGGQDCDVTLCSADGICCLILLNNRCAPHFVKNGLRTAWTAISTPATCIGCGCYRKSDFKLSTESYMFLGKDLRTSDRTKKQKVG